MVHSNANYTVAKETMTGAAVPPTTPAHHATGHHILYVYTHNYKKGTLWELCGGSYSSQCSHTRKQGQLLAGFSVKRWKHKEPSFAWWREATSTGGQIP